VPLLDLLRKAGVEDTDFLREAVEWFLQQLMEAEVTQQIGAGPHERTGARTTSRNGHRPRAWETRVGAVQLAIPKLRQGTYYPEFLEPRRRSEHALVAVIQEAYVHGVSTRKVDQLVQSLGMTGISKSQVSPLCQGLDERVTRFKQRPLESTYPYVWLDAKYLNVWSCPNERYARVSLQPKPSGCSQLSPDALSVPSNQHESYTVSGS
jgi:transposase-like protein